MDNRTQDQQRIAKEIRKLANRLNTVLAAAQGQDMPLYTPELGALWALGARIKGIDATTGKPS